MPAGRIEGDFDGVDPIQLRFPVTLEALAELETQVIFAVASADGAASTNRAPRRRTGTSAAERIRAALARRVRSMGWAGSR